MVQPRATLTVCGLLLLRDADALFGQPWPLDGHPHAGFDQDLFGGGVSWTHQSPKEDWPKGVKKQIGIRGNNRLYLVDDYVPQDWATASPISFNLLGKSISYTVDMTHVPCGTIACLYFVENRKADASSNYCDILMGGCYELDIMEANSVAWEVSTHAQTGRAFDGSCNEMGCSSNIGRYPFTPNGEVTTKLYGPGAYIDTKMLFQVQADISRDGYMQVTLKQNGNKSLVVYNRTMAGNIPDINDADAQDWTKYPKPQGVTADAARRTVEAMQKGVRLVLSVWSAADTHWLDQTGCIGKKRGAATDAQVKIYDLSIRPTPTAAPAGPVAVQPPTTATPAPLVFLGRPSAELDLARGCRGGCRGAAPPTPPVEPVAPPTTIVEPVGYFTEGATVAAGSIGSRLGVLGAAAVLLATAAAALLVAGIRSRRGVGSFKPENKLESMPLQLDSAQEDSD